MEICVHIYSMLIITFVDILIACFSTNFVYIPGFFLFVFFLNQVAKQCCLMQMMCPPFFVYYLCEILLFEINWFVLFSLLLSLMGLNISPVFFSLTRSSG